jgi:hypothetical protein
MSFRKAKRPSRTILLLDVPQRSHTAGDAPPSREKRESSKGWLVLGRECGALQGPQKNPEYY